MIQITTCNKTEYLVLNVKVYNHYEVITTMVLYLKKN